MAKDGDLGPFVARLSRLADAWSTNQVRNSAPERSMKLAPIVKVRPIAIAGCSKMRRASSSPRSPKSRTSLAATPMSMTASGRSGKRVSQYGSRLLAIPLGEATPSRSRRIRSCIVAPAGPVPAVRPSRSGRGPARRPSRPGPGTVEPWPSCVANSACTEPSVLHRRSAGRVTPPRRHHEVRTRTPAPRPARRPRRHQDRRHRRRTSRPVVGMGDGPPPRARCAAAPWATPAAPDGRLPAAQDIVLDPLIALTVAATATTRIPVGTDVLVTPWYPPVLARPQSGRTRSGQPGQARRRPRPGLVDRRVRGRRHLDGWPRAVPGGDP